MRTKALLLAAAISAAGIAASLAQSNVYSVNVVGYINYSLVSGFNLIANQLDADGTGTNNTIASTIGTNLPANSRIYAYDPLTSSYKFVTLIGGNWSGQAASITAVNAALQPGAGVFVSVSAPTTVTMVGNVLQGSLSTPVGAYYQVLSSKVPQAGLLQTDLGYTPAALDRVYQWLPGSQAYGAAKTYTGSWPAGQPNLAVGEAAFIQGHAGSAWNRTFTVQ